eukprot:scaffold670_cov333-Pavlova_lutheri.AAC.1
MDEWMDGIGMDGPDVQGTDPGQEQKRMATTIVVALIHPSVHTSEEEVEGPRQRRWNCFPSACRREPVSYVERGDDGGCPCRRNRS